MAESATTGPLHGLGKHHTSVEYNRGLGECVVLVSHRANEMLQLKEGAPGNFKTSVTGTGGFVGSMSGPAIYVERVSCAVSYQDDADVDWKRSWALEGTESGAVGGEGISGGFIVVMLGEVLILIGFPFKSFLELCGEN